MACILKTSIFCVQYPRSYSCLYNIRQLCSMAISHLRARSIGTKVKPHHWLVASILRTTALSPLNKHSCHCPGVCLRTPLPLMRVPFALVLLAII
ncbi:hypothetical protein MSAN_00467400 [Mycena sanguinolenta]|uniref:Uncharacterized protein n=1 Tax=Mycena sanguinolenta TaxID=230812 RepID=A0A8H7DJN4_9AGAR|nr:hypothetical protein MSAN_01625400 [Mycena sanguinolenta]KAF7375777.1 hypothetical protein MSAN_00467400 [Mycena sanguinolenta]